MYRAIPDGFEVQITHFRNRDEIIDTRDTSIQRGKITPIIAVTVAELVNSSGQVVATGYSHCSESDQFSKRKGREIAQGRALKEYYGD